MSVAHMVTPRELGIPETIPLPKKKEWRIGFVGFGGVAMHGHLPAYRTVGWPITAVADVDSYARQEAKSLGIPAVYDDYRHLISDSCVDVIDLCTHPNLREEVVFAAADAGKHIIIEKPFAETIEEAERMVEAADCAGIKLAVHQNYRWHQMCFYAYHIIRQGLIGCPFFASIQIFGRQDVDLANHPFYSRCQNFLTIQWDNHLADLLRYWLGLDAVRVFAHTRRLAGQNFVSDNLLSVIAEFEGGTTGYILHSELVRSSLLANECRIDGTEGSLVFDFTSYLRIQASMLGSEVFALDVSEIKFPSSWCGSMGDLLIALEEGREPLVSGRRNLHTIRTILAEERSAQAGGTWVTCFPGHPGA